MHTIGRFGDVASGKASWSVSESKSISCAVLVILMCGLESGSLQESQLAKQATVPLRLCRSLHELVTCWATSVISVHQVALMSCSLAQGLQKKEPASYEHDHHS